MLLLDTRVTAPDIHTMTSRRYLLDALSATVVGNRPEAFARFVQAEILRWAKVVQFSGAKPE